MLLSVILAAANFLLAFLETRFLKFPSFDIAPIGTVIAAQQGESVLFAALIISAPYALLSKEKLHFLWATLPLTIVIGYLGLAIENPVLLILLFHLVLAAVALVLGRLFGKYFVFALVNLAVNLAAARVYVFVV